jgi:CHASE2 domain-containing sensor protein
MHDVLLFSLQLVLGVVLPAAVVRRDIRRLPPRERARAWPDPSVWIAVALVSVFAVPLHFIRTRRTFRGVLLGIGWFVGVYLAVLGPVLLLEAALE